MSQKVLLSKLADIISAVEFDHTGDYLATGDRGGRVVLFERNEGVFLFDLEKNLRIQVLYGISIA
jgi:hypothetical protein